MSDSSMQVVDDKIEGAVIALNAKIDDLLARVIELEQAAAPAIALAKNNL